MAKKVEEYVIRNTDGSRYVYYKTDKGNYYYYQVCEGKYGQTIGRKNKINENTYNLFKPCGEMVAV